MGAASSWRCSSEVESSPVKTPTHTHSHTHTHHHHHRYHHHHTHTNSHLSERKESFGSAQGVLPTFVTIWGSPGSSSISDQSSKLGRSYEFSQGNIHPHIFCPGSGSSIPSESPYSDGSGRHPPDFFVHSVKGSPENIAISSSSNFIFQHNTGTKYIKYKLD